MSAAPKAPAVDDETRLARLHLRVGMLSMARAELEDLDGRGLLDLAGRAVLAEARWRTGDLDDAAAAARAHLDDGGDDPVAICIAAEAAAADGRPGEARGYMDRLGPPDAAALDALFAGMPRRGFWPSAAGGPLSSDTLFDDAAAGDLRVGAPNRHGPATTIPPDRPARQAPPARSIPGPREVIESTEPGFWGETAGVDGEPAKGAPSAPGTRQRSLAFDPAAELATAVREMPTEPDRSLLRLAIVLRIDPTLAPAVLDALGGRREPAAALLRGDAQRLLGRHLEAEAAFAGAAEALDKPINQPSRATVPEEGP